MGIEIGSRIILKFENGFYITETACYAAIVALLMIVYAAISTRKMGKVPKGVQAVNELIVETVYGFVKRTMGAHNLCFAPYIGTLFVYIMLCSAIGLLGQRAPSSDMNFTFAMSILVFVIIQASAIKARGVKGYLKHFAEPFPFMVPIKILEEVSFPISLGFRLFGNILAGVIIIELFFSALKVISVKVLGSFGSVLPIFQMILPLPLNAFFDVLEPILQAFVFSMLAMIFIAKGLPKPGEESH